LMVIFFVLPKFSCDHYFIGATDPKNFLAYGNGLDVLAS